MDFDFEWDPGKDKLNAQKHGIRFEEAATVFVDPRHISIFDEKHSADEDRWVTFGISSKGRILAVCHTFFQEDEEDRLLIRVISCRKASPREQRQYGGTI